MSIIRQIVGRCHVGDSNLRVIRYMVSRIKGGYKGWVKHPREVRRAAMRQAIELHQENRAEYRWVMGSH